MSADIYFFISIPKSKKEETDDIIFIVPEDNRLKPECIYSVKCLVNNNFYLKNIFKANQSIRKDQKENKYYFEFKIGEEIYTISFDAKGNKFVYDVNLEIKRKRNIDQTNIEYTEKINIFQEALEKKGDINLIYDLYKEMINSYPNEKLFSVIIDLFLKIYTKKDLCSLLIRNFKEMNLNQKDNNKIIFDVQSYLKEYTSKVDDVIIEADKLIEENSYNTIEFYGIILCYLNFYNKEKFCVIIKKLYNEKIFIIKKNFVLLLKNYIMKSQMIYMNYYLFIIVVLILLLNKVLNFLINLQNILF